MPDQLTQDDLLAEFQREIPDEYTAPMKASPGGGFEIAQGYAKSLERTALAVKRFETDGYVETAAGPARATVPLIFYRETATAGTVKILPGTIVSARSSGVRFRLMTMVTLTGTTATAAQGASIGYGYEYNVAGQFVDPDGGVWPGEIDTIEFPVLDPPFGDPSIQVRNDDAATGGRPGTLDAHGDERNLPRQPAELDASYKVRISILPDTVSPAAIKRQITSYLRQYGFKWRSIETFRHEYQECYDAPSRPPTPTENYNSNLFVYDDPRPASPFQNRNLSDLDYLGAFIVEITNPTPIRDFGGAYDDPSTGIASVSYANGGARALLAYDTGPELAAPALPGAYDAGDRALWGVLVGLWSLLDAIKLGGVYFAIVITPPNDLAPLTTSGGILAF